MKFWLETVKLIFRAGVRKPCYEFGTPSHPVVILQKAAFGGMKIMVATGILIGLLIRAQAIPITQTYVFNLPGSSSIIGPDFYTYGFSWSLPAGQQIVDAQLTFNNTRLTTLSQLPGGNLLWIHLLDSNTSHRRGEFSDPRNNSDAFSGKGVLIGTTTFSQVGATYNTLTYDLANVPGALDALSSYLANGGFGLGIDPDASFRSTAITFTITTGPQNPTGVPDNGKTAALLCVGVLGVLVVRRKVCVH
jgi:hypothetical protein